MTRIKLCPLTPETKWTDRFFKTAKKTHFAFNIHIVNYVHKQNISKIAEKKDEQAFYK